MACDKDICYELYMADTAITRELEPKKTAFSCFQWFLTLDQWLRVEDQAPDTDAEA